MCTHFFVVKANPSNAFKILTFQLKPRKYNGKRILEDKIIFIMQYFQHSFFIVACVCWIVDVDISLRGNSSLRKRYIYTTFRSSEGAKPQVAAENIRNSLWQKQGKGGESKRTSKRAMVRSVIVHLNIAYMLAAVRESFYIIYCYPAWLYAK